MQQRLPLDCRGRVFVDRDLRQSVRNCAALESDAYET